MEIGTLFTRVIYFLARHYEDDPGDGIAEKKQDILLKTIRFLF